MHELYEAIEPEPTDEEIEADYVDRLLQTAPPIVWTCYCVPDDQCHICREERSAVLRNVPMRSAYRRLRETALPHELASNLPPDR